jgi:hypothetical protein
MRKIMFLGILLVLLLGVVNAETYLNMELWNRWTYKMIDGEDDAAKNELSLARGYLGFDHNFTNRITGKFILDFFSKDTSGMDGVGIKLRVACVKFSEYLWKDADFTFGLMPVYFGTIYDWGYATIDLSPTDMYGFAVSTDYGMGLHGLIPSGLGEYHVAVYNGEGYTKTGNALDTNMSILGNIRFTPVPGVVMGGSYYMNPVETMYWDGQGQEIAYDFERNIMAGFLRFNTIKGLDIWGQYVSGTYTAKYWDYLDDQEAESELTSNVISIISIINIAEFTSADIEAVFRYDIYDDDADLDNDAADSEACDLLIAGLNYYLVRDAKNKPKLWLQANYSMKNYIFEDLDDESEIKLQMRWKISEKIN